MLEAGRATPSDKTLHIIARRLGKPVGYFLDEGVTDAAADTAASILQSARQLLEAGQVEAALNLLRDVPEETGDHKLWLDTQCLLIDCLARLRRHEEALATCETVLQRLEQSGDRDRLTWVYMRMGAAAFALEQFGVSKRAYEQAVICSSELKRNVDVHIDALTYLGTSLLRLGELQEAIGIYQRAFAAAMNQGDLARSANAARGLGKATFDLGLEGESLQWTSRAVALLEQAGSDELVYARHNLGVLQAATGHAEQAYATFRLCLQTYQEKGQPDMQASVLEELAALWLRHGDCAQAKSCCREALALLDQKDDGVLRGRLYRLLGKAFLEEGDRERAGDALRMSYDLLRRIRAAKEAEVSLQCLSRV